MTKEHKKNLQYTLKIMRLVIQQVKSAKLDIEESNIHREIWRWIIIYLWIHVDDLDTYPEKIARIMKKFPLLKWLTGPDWNINTSLQDIDWEVLLVSNFTLYGRSTKWTKLDFVHSAPYKKAEGIYNYFIQEAKANWRKIQTWEFWADMTVTSVNEWPLNYVLDY
jgi:D-tyrosyl-tRNA(Tyr) deacylase